MALFKSSKQSGKKIVLYRTSSTYEVAVIEECNIALLQKAMYKCALSLIDYHFRNAHTCDVKIGFF